MPTIAQVWKAEGEAIGEAKGKEENTWEIIKNALKEGLPLNIIERITGVPADKINGMKEKLARS